MLHHHSETPRGTSTVGAKLNKTQNLHTLTAPVYATVPPTHECVGLKGHKSTNVSSGPISSAASGLPPAYCLVRSQDAVRAEVG